ncbi:ABC transporter substrate-binding protein [Colwellia sp. Arc7-D]|jgi:phospholipid transport system substrate-binding protein|uniref:MlaC/ttg2D family ABC transporter substrate-binding protein n=1 Tax=Colwellia sp. Arc7-D TaxID=2161872 RepID=UPI000D3B8036|nr:ABC transporter substrate-binding protein [Colwellia sp. Arc7-D]AWB59057.1 toluene tolerance protein [Colwellia sp. Arc7-D]|tara:strand:- start:446 stop:1084 length:639 start_codon:yes stop_codon:yes gene_type:complete
MNSLIKHLILCITFLAVSTGVSAEEVNKKDPYQMIKTVADITFKRFANEQAAIQVEPNLLKTIVREELMPYINYQYAAYKVIGSNFKKTNKTERAEFVPAFREYLITSYAQVFTLYNNQKVEFAPPKDFTDERVVSVATSVIEPGRPPIDISFRVRKHKKTGDWKAYDMVAEGISLLDSKQAELSSLIRQKGLSHVTEMLKEKSQKNIEFKQ